MVDIEWGLKKLDQVYHSEDHFKLSLAAELARMYGDGRVRLEWNSGTQAQVDIGVRREGVTIPVELKYKTDETTIENESFDESFELARQGAHPDAHYRLFEDVRRVEQIVAEQGRYGYIVLLTNDSNYWSPPEGSETLYDAFRIHEGRVVEGTIEWRDISDWMHQNDIAEPIALEGQYQMEWSDYTYRDDILVSANPDFRHLVLRVSSTDVNEE